MVIRMTTAKTPKQTNLAELFKKFDAKAAALKKVEDPNADMTVREAVARSLNTIQALKAKGHGIEVAHKLMQECGIKISLSTLKSYVAKAHKEKNPAAAAKSTPARRTGTSGENLSGKGEAQVDAAAERTHDGPTDEPAPVEPDAVNAEANGEWADGSA